MGWICNKTNNVTYKAIDIDNDRISGIQIIVQGKTVMNILDVYLPFHNGSSDQIELYGETLECLHSKIDSYHGEPIIIVGDFNATLPQQQSLSHNWSKRRPFNADSMLLYDFICDNELYVANYYSMFDFISFVMYIVESILLSSYVVWRNDLLIHTMLLDGFILLESFVTPAGISMGIKLRTEFFSHIMSN